MRMPQGALPADVEVLSEADLAAEGLVTFAALANMTATELIAAAGWSSWAAVSSVVHIS